MSRPYLASLTTIPTWSTFKQNYQNWTLWRIFVPLQRSDYPGRVSRLQFSNSWQRNLQFRTFPYKTPHCLVIWSILSISPCSATASSLFATASATPPSASNATAPISNCPWRCYVSEEVRDLSIFGYAIELYLCTEGVEVDRCEKLIVILIAQSVYLQWRFIEQLQFALGSIQRLARHWAPRLWK